ncbi:MAG TPA: hypothetical protein VGQ94_05050 [Terriglobales bacterium]|nr:hypothetical protein [Terriglobales bacterium]
MPHPEEQLVRLAQAGFEFQTFERFPRSLGILKGDCIALVEPTPEGLKMIGTPGWRMGEVMGVLVTKGARQVFQAKGETLEATPERVEELGRFRAELASFL